MLKDKELTDELVLDWYKRAVHEKINIFDNQNEIIALLAKELLKMRGIDVKTYKKT